MKRIPYLFECANYRLVPNTTQDQMGPKKCARNDRPPCSANYHYIVPVYHHRESIYRLRVGVPADGARLWSVPRGLFRV